MPVTAEDRTVKPVFPTAGTFNSIERNPFPSVHSPPISEQWESQRHHPARRREGSFAWGTEAMERCVVAGWKHSLMSRLACGGAGLDFARDIEDDLPRVGGDRHGHIFAAGPTDPKLA